MQYRLKRQMSLNLPQPVMDALIAEAEKQDRSRSYVAERAIRAYLKLGDTSPGKARPAEDPFAASPIPLTDLQRISEAQKGRYGEAGQLDTDWPDALERSVPPLEFSA
jgi:hypothetical protein